MGGVIVSTNSRLVRGVILVVTFTGNTINNCVERDKSYFWSGCNEFALSVGCNDDFSLGVVMIILSAQPKCCAF